MEKLQAWSSKAYIGFMAILAVISIVFAVFMYSLVILKALEMPVYTTLWKFTKPKAYYMQVIEESYFHKMRWEVYVEDNTPIIVNLLKDECIDEGYDGTACDRSLETENMTIEYMFDLAKGACELDGWDCSIEFDSTYGYPKRNSSRHGVHRIEIENFVPCKYQVDCPLPSHLED